MQLSKHFCDNWRIRVGGEPLEPTVKAIIEESVPLQDCRVFQLEDGRPYKRLALYWHPDWDLVISVDTCRNVAVSVLSRQNWIDRQRRRQRLSQGGQSCPKH